MMLGYSVAIIVAVVSYVLAQGSDSCQATTQYLPDPPYDNYFYSDCNVDAQAVVTSPLPDSNLSIIGPRVVVAWPAGNSGICTFFQPENGQNGSLAIELVNSTYGSPLGPVYINDSSSDYPFVGVQGVLSFNSSAQLTIAILGSVRTIRDFTEGPSLLRPVIQDAINVTRVNETGASFSRLWLDNVTITTVTLIPYESDSNITIDAENKTITFDAGNYTFSTYFNYPQLTQLPPDVVLNNASQDLVDSFPSQTTSLSFLSYTEKLLAGAWRFLTYFGRDSMITAMLLEDVLSVGNASAIEAVIGAVLERINRTDGSVCHEETIGDYATYLNLQNNITSTEAGFTYPMIDTDFYLPVLMNNYFQRNPSRIQPLLSRQAGSVDPANANLTYGELALINAEKIMNITAAFGTEPTIANLIHLKSSEIVGEWRDSTYGLGGGRIPFDVNCALVPAALNAISSLASTPGVFPNASTNPQISTWTSIALFRAKIWEDSTLGLFEYNTTVADATSSLNTFVNSSLSYNGPTHASSLSTYSGNDTITSYALALDGYNSLDVVRVQHSDTAFRLYLLNTTDQAQLTRFLNSTANEIIRPFPAGLSSPVGMLVANPALGNSSVLTANFTNSAYHGTVVWSWQLAFMAKGLQRQIARCVAPSPPTAEQVPHFCTADGGSVLSALRAAYDVLWDGIDANTAQLQSEVWSWTFTAANGTGDGDFRVAPLGSLPPPPGVSSGTESNVRQLWSLGFLGVTRNSALGVQ